MRSALAPRLALLVASTVAVAALAGDGCMVLLDLPEYTLCGPKGEGGCGGAGGGEGAPDGGATDAHGDR